MKAWQETGLALALLILVGCAAETKAPDAVAAGRLAARLANAETVRQYETAPFPGEHATITMVSNGWNWEGWVGHGKGTLRAKVSFDSKGENQKVEVQLLVDEF
jgi:hypothetical protein